MYILSWLKVAVVALLCSTALAHPKLSSDELTKYHENARRTNEALGRCLEQPHMKELNSRMLKHRTAATNQVLQARGIQTNNNMYRDKEALKHWVTVNHKHDGQSVEPQQIWKFDWKERVHSFPGACALAMQQVYGPYWMGNQPERADIRDGQVGTYMRLAMQVIDVATCMPLPHARVDVWQANANGEYNGTATGWLRGWQPSSVYGTVDFDSIFPGHYAGRATHVHVLVRPDGQTAVHVGMLYFDDALRDAVEKSPEYARNQNPVVNAIDDEHAAWAASAKYDPFVQWSWLGQQPSDGVLAWIAMGVNLTDSTIEQPKPATQGSTVSLFDDHLDHSLLA